MIDLGLDFQYDKDGVPFATAEKMESVAEDILTKCYGDAYAEPHALDVDDFLENKLGLNMEYQLLSNNMCYYGTMVFKDSVIPVYNEEANDVDFINVASNTVVMDVRLLDKNKEHIYRFTAGHEAGHFIAHGGYFKRMDLSGNLFGENKREYFQCCSKDINNCSNVGKWDAKHRMEWQANYLSAALIMPKKAVLNYYNILLPGNYDVNDWLEEKKRFASLFNVSPQAAEIRIKDVNKLWLKYNNLAQGSLF